jgi:WhiB family redox-sensing transcriptional regulator
MSAPNWTGAACADVDPELMFPLGQSARVIAEAKAVCARCLMVAECLTYATETRQQHGVWGGLDEDERERIWRA